MAVAMAARHVGVDTGGTFTDLVEIDREGRIRFDKTFSTPSAPEEAVFDVLTRVAIANGVDLERYLAGVGRFAHGTTVATNALIQRRGARVGLLTTRGFEDTLEIARGPMGRAGGIPQSRAMDFLHTEPPPPLVPRAMIRGLSERITVTGEVIAALDEDEAASAIRDLLAAGAESLAVCFLWSFRNPEHERKVRAVAGRVAQGVPVSLSSDVAPRMGEFERMATTVVNAFIGPITRRYIDSLQRKLAAQGLRHPVQVMKSSGGVTLAPAVADQAVSVVNSGPVGGLVAARYLGRLLGYDRIITADMGGTSFDVGLIADGRFEEQSSPFLDQGLPVHVPAIKLVTIGAGGGSIAWTDGFRLRVGPESAGADPGPAAYGRGGTQPTVTDALVTLGIIDPEHFFGGRYALDAGRARAAIADKVAGPLGLDVMDAAAAIYEVVTARMGDLIRKVTVESGHDPREFCLIAYGGATGAHCAAFARSLGVRRVLLPYAAPVFSALGCALSDIVYSHVRSEPVPADERPETLALINRTFADLAAKARADMAVSGIEGENGLEMRYRIDVRYQGQMNEVSLPWPEGAFVPGDMATLRAEFEALYEHRFGAGTTRSDMALELISFRAEAVCAVPKPSIARLFERETPEACMAPPRRRRVWQHGQGRIEAAVYDFAALVAGPRIEGPAIIERDTTTVWLPPGAAARLDVYGNLLIDPGSAS